MPFIVESEPDDRPVTNVWQFTWYLPFKIRPIGKLDDKMPWSRAIADWRFLRDSDNRGGVVSGTRVFAPEPMPRHEWDRVLEGMGVDPEEHGHRW